jgi:hypothetical protein
MRHRLAENLRCVAARASDHLTAPPDRLASFLARLEQGPASPHGFVAAAKGRT